MSCFSFMGFGFCFQFGWSLVHFVYMGFMSQDGFGEEVFFFKKAKLRPMARSLLGTYRFSLWEINGQAHFGISCMGCEFAMGFTGNRL